MTLVPDLDSNGNFLGHSHLSVSCDDRLNSPVGILTLDETDIGGVQVTFVPFDSARSVQQVTFMPGEISEIDISISIDISVSTHEIAALDIEHTLAGVPVRIMDSAGTEINISFQFHNLDNLQGPVSITGHSVLGIHDENNTAATNYTLNGGAVGRDNAAPITYDGRLELLCLYAGRSGTVNVEGTSVRTDVGFAAVGAGTVNVSPTSHTLGNLHGELDVVGYEGSTGTVNLYDQGDSASATYTTDRFDLVPFLKRTVGTVTTSVQVLGMSLNLHGSAGTDVFNLEQTFAAPITFYAGAGANTINLSPTAQRLENLGSAVTVRGNGSATALNVDDQADGTARTYSVTGTTVQYAGLQAITYSQLSDLEVNVGSAADVVNVEGTSARTQVNASSQTTAVNVCPAGQNLDTIHGPLLINGAGGPSRATAVTVNDRANPDSPVLLSGTTYTLNNSGELTRDAAYNRLTGLTVTTTHVRAVITTNFVQGLIVYTGNYSNADVVTGTSVPTTISAGAGGDAVTVGPRLSLGSLLTVNANGGPLTLDDRRTLDRTLDESDGTTSRFESFHHAPTCTLTAGALSWLDHVTDTVTTRTLGQPATTVTTTFDATQEVDFTGVSSLQLFGAPEASTFNLLGTPAGIPTGVTGGGSADTIAVGGAASSLDGIGGALTLDGGPGQNTLSFNDQAAARATGSLSGRSYAFAPGSVTRGGGPVMSFSHFAAVNLTGTAYDDSLLLGAGVPAATMDLELGAGFDSAYGPQTDNVWAINGNGRALLNGLVTIGGIDRVAGGSGADRFVFLPGGVIPSTLSGGGGFNVLDYSQYPAAVTVNLAAFGTYGSATGVGSSVSGSPNVVGSAFNDSITGLGSGVLVGGDGDDTLTAGAGPSILIGGRGRDTLTGGSADDVLIGGYTDYDTQLAGSTVTHNIDVAALADLLREWSRADLPASSSYATRINHLRGADLVTPRLNNNHFLTSATVHDDGVLDTLTGAGGMDWFWALASEVRDRATGEVLN
jgi:Ca2+-binding RTX toxin-like protein